MWFITTGIFPWSTPGEGVRKMELKEKVLETVKKLYRDMKSSEEVKSDEFEDFISGIERYENLDDFRRRIIKEVLVSIIDVLEWSKEDYDDIDEIINEIDDNVDLEPDIYLGDLLEWAGNLERVNYIEEIMKEYHFTNFFELLQYAQSIEIYEIYIIVMEELKKVLEEFVEEEES